jgi:tetratricopeptide (TPR) repeat protein
MRKFYVIALLLFIFTGPGFSQENLLEGVKDAKTLTSLTQELHDNITKLKNLVGEGQDARDVDLALSPFIWRLNFVLDYFNLWLAMRDKEDRAAAWAYLNAEGNQFVRRCDRMRETLETEKEKLKTIGKAIDQIMNDIHAFLFPFEDAYVKTDKDALAARTERDNNLESNAYEARGVYEYSRGRYQNAVSDLERASKLRPTYGSANYYLALSYIQLGNTEKTVELLDSYLNLVTPLVESMTHQDLYYVTKCFDLAEKIKYKKYPVPFFYLMWMRTSRKRSTVSGALPS